MSNRTIKFRAWDGEKLVFPDYVDRSGTAWWKENSIPERSTSVMQYVGKTDSYGNEIYEGDFIKVGQLKPVYVVIWDNEFSNFRMKDVSSESGYGFGYTNYNLKVIGNIYENPELLKTK